MFEISSHRSHHGNVNRYKRENQVLAAEPRLFANPRKFAGKLKLTHPGGGRDTQVVTTGPWKSSDPGNPGLVQS